MQIVDFEPRYAADFEKLNKAWLEKYFYVEDRDEWVLTHPDEAILHDGGTILVATEGSQAIGTVALQVLSPGTYELTKMAVDEKYQGRGTGRKLCEAAIDKARDLGASRLILYSNTLLKNAIHIYRQLGFTEVPVEKGRYHRADIKMERAI